MAVLRVIFMGTPDFALSPLRALVENSPHEVVAVYTQPPRPKGRGYKTQPSPVQNYAEKQGIRVYTPKSLKNSSAQGEFAALDADVAVVAAYGLILPRAILEAPKHGCLNIHASLLPRWRGAAPIQRAILAGDDHSGISIMQMDEGLDTGAVIAEKAIPITLSTTSSILHDSLSEIGAELICVVLDRLATAGKLKSTPQSNEDFTYASMLTKEDGRIAWNQNARHIDRQIRALNPWPGTFSGNFKIRVAELTDHSTDQPPGTILDKKGYIACGGGSVLKLVKVQPAGKKIMDFAAALNGGYVRLGDSLT